MNRRRLIGTLAATPLALITGRSELRPLGPPQFEGFMTSTGVHVMETWGNPWSDMAVYGDVRIFEGDRYWLGPDNRIIRMSGLRA